GGFIYPTTLPSTSPGVRGFINPTKQQSNDGPLFRFHGLRQPGFLKASRFCRAHNIPYVGSPHGMLEPWALRHKAWKKWPYFLLFERRHLRGAAAVLATSDMEAANVTRFFPPAHCRSI